MGTKSKEPEIRRNACRRYLVARVVRQFCLVPACMFGGQFFPVVASRRSARPGIVWTGCLNPRLPYSWGPSPRAGQRGLLIAASLFRSRIATVSDSIIRFIPELGCGFKHFFLAALPQGQAGGAVPILFLIPFQHTELDCHNLLRPVSLADKQRYLYSFRVAPVPVQLLSD